MAERPKCLVAIPCDESTRVASPFFVVRAAFFDRGRRASLGESRVCIIRPGGPRRPLVGPLTLVDERSIKTPGSLPIRPQGPGAGMTMGGVRKSEWAVERATSGCAHSDFSAS